MKRLYPIFFLFIFATGIHLGFGQYGSAKPVIVIDPGHGGIDAGTIGINGLKEKDVVLKIAKETLRLHRI